MNSILLCVAILVAVAEGAKIVHIKREADSHLVGERTIRNLASTMFGPGNGNTFRPTTDEVVPSSKGVNRKRLTQTFHGIDVLGTMAEAEVGLDGEPTGQMYGAVAQGLDGDIPDAHACEKNVESMIALAMVSEGIDPSDSHVTKKDGALYVYVDADTEKASLIYRVEFFYDNGDDFGYPAYYIDACDEFILFSFNQVQNATVPRAQRDQMYKRQNEEDDQCETEQPPPPAACDPQATGVGGNGKTGAITYNVPGKCLEVERTGNLCVFSNSYAKVVDNQRSGNRNKQTVASFDCDQGYQDEVNGAFGVANDAFYFGTITGKLYTEKYNIRALPYAPRLVIHYNECYDNAFWDGTDMYFGDGCSTFFPLVNQDVVTHELGHGITSRNSNLEYRRQSGGINEAFSDISGEVAEVFGRGSNDWKVGFELFKSANGALRYFINPPDDGRSIKHISSYSDSMDVHYSSGIYNHAFYQLVQIQGMDIFDAYKCFLTANLLTWRSTTGFQDGACNVMQACYDNGIDHEKVKDAFSVVGINLDSCDFAALTTIVAAGSPRDQIKVSATHKPILKIDLGQGTSGNLEAYNSDSDQITLTVTSDAGGKDVIATGQNSITFTAQASYAYVKLSANSASDLTVTLKNSG